MALVNLEPFDFDVSEKVKKQRKCYEEFLSALKRKQTSSEFDSKINSLTDSINQMESSDPKLRIKLRSAYSKGLRLAEKESGYVPPRTYMTRWIAIGMAAIGVPLGVAMGLVLNNMAFMGAFIGVGLAIGAGLGASMDKKAEQEERVLDVKSM